jgi:hypothetical protein
MKKWRVGPSAMTAGAASETAAVRELGLSNQPALTSKVVAHSETGRLIATTTRTRHMFLQPAAMIASQTV